MAFKMCGLKMYSRMDIRPMNPFSHFVARIIHEKGSRL